MRIYRREIARAAGARASRHQGPLSTFHYETGALSGADLRNNASLNKLAASWHGLLQKALRNSLRLLIRLGIVAIGQDNHGHW
jgi:hypothetical protein